MADHVRGRLVAATVSSWGDHPLFRIQDAIAMERVAAFDRGERVVVPAGYLPAGLRDGIGSDHVEVDRDGTVVPVWPVCFFPVVDGRRSPARHQLCWSADGPEDLDEESARARYPERVDEVLAGINAWTVSTVVDTVSPPADPEAVEDVVRLDERRNR